jgi:hypothetical protein
VLHVRRMCCWMDCSLPAPETSAIHNVFGPSYRILVSTLVA